MTHLDQIPAPETTTISWCACCHRSRFGRRCPECGGDVTLQEFVHRGAYDDVLADRTNSHAARTFAVSADALETAGLVRLTIQSGVVDFAILLDSEQAIDLHRAVAHAARAVCEAAA